MCGRFAMDDETNALIEEFVAENGYAALDGWKPSWNIKPTSLVPVLLESAKGEGEVQRRLELARWSLVPQWAKEPKLKFPTFNARSETAAEKPTFKASVKSKRAVLPVTGYYEWKTEGKTKTPFFIHSPGERLMLAGLYTWWRPPGSTDDAEWMLTTTILTRAAVGGVAEIHDRTPVTLPAHLVDQWLDASTVGDQGLVDEAVAAATPVSEALEYYEVAPLRGDGPELIAPLDSN